MKTTLLRWNALTSVFSVLFLLSALCPLSSVFAQGSLTPPGGPAPTMKSLDQVAPRTPISSLPFTISSSGGYYLTKSLNIASGDAIIIAVSGVTLDLNGFEITSTEGSPAHSGILINGGLRNIRIANGQIRGNVTLSGSTFSGSGFANGIQTTGAAPVNAHISDVSIAGCLSNGINLGGGLVESCTVSVIGGTGITADTVVYSNAYNFGSIGIQAFVSATGCYATSNATTGPSAGINAGYIAIGCVADCKTSGAAIGTEIARDCVASTGGTGDAIFALTAENCNGFAATGSGIHCSQSATNCYGSASSGSSAGVNVSAGTALNCWGHNGGTGNGLSALSAQNCYGSAQGPTSGTIGIGLMAKTAENCYGVCHAANGLNANVALNCYGEDTTGGDGSTASSGLIVNQAFNCVASGGGNGLAMFATIASFCNGSAGINSNHQYFCGSGPNPYP